MIDLGSVRNVTRIEIQGRPHSNEYVTEFSISYGFNGQDYIDYKEPGGNTKVKKARFRRATICKLEATTNEPSRPTSQLFLSLSLHLSCKYT